MFCSKKSLSSVFVVVIVFFFAFCFSSNTLKAEEISAEKGSENIESYKNVNLDSNNDNLKIDNDDNDVVDEKESPDPIVMDVKDKELEKGIVYREDNLNSMYVYDHVREKNIVTENIAYIDDDLEENSDIQSKDIINDELNFSDEENDIDGRLEGLNTEYSLDNLNNNDDGILTYLFPSLFAKASSFPNYAVWKYDSYSGVNIPGYGIGFKCYSNYYHPSRYHCSTVKCKAPIFSRNNAHTIRNCAPAGEWSYASMYCAMKCETYYRDEF